MERVLVTGGSGYLAGHCIVQLLEQGYEVRTTVRSLSREAEVREATGAGDRLEFAVADLGADEGWAEAVAGCHYVLHVASPFPPAQPKNPDELIEDTRNFVRNSPGLAIAGAAIVGFVVARLIKSGLNRDEDDDS